MFFLFYFIVILFLAFNTLKLVQLFILIIVYLKNWDEITIQTYNIYSTPKLSINNYYILISNFLVANRHISHYKCS